MSASVTAIGCRKGSDLVLEHRAAFLRQCQQFGEGEELLVTVAPVKPAVTKKARGYYFGVVLRHLADHSGHTIDDLHAWAKAKFTPKHLAIVDGNGNVVDDLVIGSTTTDFDPHQFFDFVEALRAFMLTELGIVTPDPDPRWKEKATAA